VELKKLNTIVPVALFAQITLLVQIMLFVCTYLNLDAYSHSHMCCSIDLGVENWMREKCLKGSQQCWKSLEQSSRRSNKVRTDVSACFKVSYIPSLSAVENFFWS
jgi:hypothetical protein